MLPLEESVPPCISVIIKRRGGATPLMGDTDMPDQSPWRTRSQGIRSQSQVLQETLRQGDLCAAVFLGRK